MLWVLQRGMAALAVVVFFLNAVLLAVPKTQAGIQCPTAPVQLITVTELRKNCCGNLEKVLITRKPKVGEAGFRQCDCAEKQAAATADDRSVSKSIVFVLPPSSTPLDLPPVQPTPRILGKALPVYSLEQAPPVPPPPNA